MKQLALFALFALGEFTVTAKTLGAAQTHGAATTHGAAKTQGAAQTHGAAKVQTSLITSPITKVVEMLQNIVVQAKKQGKVEHALYAKSKCYCDDTKVARKKDIVDKKKSVALHQAKIEELQGSIGELSSTLAGLVASLAENAQDQGATTTMDTKAKEAFRLRKADLTQGIQQMKSAIATLFKVGADQTDEETVSADNSQNMAGHKATSFLSVQSQMQSVLADVEPFMNEEQYSDFTASSFLQGPFTGTYSSQSAGVMGIIKSMKDTFEADLKTATANENSRLKSHSARMSLLRTDQKEREDLKNTADSKIGDNDKLLAATRSLLSNAKESLALDTTFMYGSTKDGTLGLVQTCSDKHKDFENKKLLRTQEEASIAGAIAILTSDEAFAVMSKVDANAGLLQKSAKAKKKASLLQMSFLQMSSQSPSGNVRDVVDRLLRRAADEKAAKEPTRIKHVVSVLQAKNPFDTVSAEIKNMIASIKQESELDTQKLAWCRSQQHSNQASLKKINSQVIKLEGTVQGSTNLIMEPKDGFKDTIAGEESSLRRNNQDQVSGTKDRAAENAAYQENIKNLVAAQGLMTDAIQVLTAYYGKLEKADRKSVV